MPTLNVSDPKFAVFMTGCPTRQAGDQGLYNWAQTLYNMAVTPPVLTSLSPNTIAHGAGDTKVTCTGSGFTRGSIAQSGATPLASGAPNSTTLLTTIPQALLAAAGTLSITVLSPDNQVSSAQTFTVT